MLSFYFAFFSVNRPYYDPNRVICMAEFLFKVQQQNRLEQKGLLRRFSVNCYGTQLTMEKMREEKANKYKELKKHRGSKEWNWYFLKYAPADPFMLLPHPCGHVSTRPATVSSFGNRWMRNPAHEIATV